MKETGKNNINNNSNPYNNNNQNFALVIKQMMLNMMNKNIKKIEQTINQRKAHQRAKANPRQSLKDSKTPYNLFKSKKRMS